MSEGVETGGPVAAVVAEWLAGLSPGDVPARTRDMARRLLVDVAGLSVAARRQPYVEAVLASADGRGLCTSLGHPGGFTAFDAALINGTAAHGEDFDDTFEGGPVHSGAVIVPAMLALCERERLSGERLLVGVAAGVEVMCRLSLVAPMGVHKAGFHPTAVFGALAAAAAASAALGLDAPTVASALGIAGSMSSGIIEYLAEGTWTKRMHAGWAAQAGVRAALMARGGFMGPRTVLDGTHGFYRAFAHPVAARFEPLVDALGARWVADDIAFKPYACGTMTQPFIDCAIELADTGVRAEDISEIVCQVGEGTVHRLWEPLGSKHRPPTPYAAKFSTPYCMAVGFFDRRAGFAQFTDTRVHDPAVLALAEKIRYQINPNDPYPRAFVGHLRATVADGRVHEIERPHMRGGVGAPMTDAEVEAKFLDNAEYGGWTRAVAKEWLAFARAAFDAPTLEGLREFAQ